MSQPEVKKSVKKVSKQKFNLKKKLSKLKKKHVNDMNSIIDGIIGTEKNVLNFSESAIESKDDGVNDSIKEEVNSSINMEVNQEMNHSSSNLEQLIEFPTVCEHKFELFLKSLQQTNPIKAYEKDVQNCANTMNTSGSGVHWKSKMALLNAIRDSILKRKWNNVTFLLKIASDNSDAFLTIWPFVSKTVTSACISPNLHDFYLIGGPNVDKTTSNNSRSQFRRKN